MGSIADHALESLECLADRYHPALCDLVLKVSNETRGMRYNLHQRLSAGLSYELCQTPARNHELTDEIHQRVETLGIDTNAAAGVNAGGSEYRQHRRVACRSVAYRSVTQRS